MSYALLFSGQGTQHPEMLPWLGDTPLVRATCRRLGVDDWRAALAEPGWATRNLHAQLLLTGLGLAAWRELAPGLPPPAAVAGYSVGEMAAWAAAGVYDDETALRLAAQRAEAMDTGAAIAKGGLVAVTGLPDARLQALRAETGTELAIDNGPGSAVCGGPVEGLDALEAAATAEGARCTRLRIGVASHTSAMAGARQAFAAVLAATPFARPATVLVANADGRRVRDAATARDALAAQLSTTVQWRACMALLLERQPRCVVEIGPGQALARLWQAQAPDDVPARSCDDFRSAQALVQWVRRCCA